MSTVSEIETAIEKLPPAKVEELAAWLDDYRQTLHAAAAVFALLEEEENRTDAGCTLTRNLDH
jgi:hypothetical protein